MIIYSIQSKNILNILKEKNKYIPNEKYINDKLKTPYNNLCKKLKYNNYPIWGMYKTCNGFIKDRTYEDYLKYDYIDYIEKGSILLKLNINKELLEFSSYWEWGHYINIYNIFDEHDDITFNNSFLDKNNLEDINIIQVTFPYIINDMIMDIYEINNVNELNEIHMPIE